MENIEHLISQYIDNELDEMKTKILFERLNNDPEARTALRSYLIIEKEAYLFTHLSTNGDLFAKFEIEKKNTHQEFVIPKELNAGFKQKLISRTELRKSNAGHWTKRQKPVYVSYLLGLIIVFLLFISLNQINGLRDEIVLANKQLIISNDHIKTQNETIRVLLNSLPVLKVNASETNQVLRVKL